MDLLSALQSDNHGLRHAAVIFLGKARDRRAVPRLTEILARDGSELLCCDVAEALGNIGTTDAVPALENNCAYK